MLLLVKHTGIKFMSLKMSLMGGGLLLLLFHIRRRLHEFSRSLRSTNRRPNQGLARTSVLTLTLTDSLEENVILIILGVPQSKLTNYQKSRHPGSLGPRDKPEYPVLHVVAQERLRPAGHSAVHLVISEHTEHCVCFYRTGLLSAALSDLTIFCGAP